MDFDGLSPYDNTSNSYKYEDLDLYNDIVANPRESAENRTLNSLSTQKLPCGIPNDYNGKKVPVIVTNMQWWTSDRDLMEAISALGISDLMEIKFYENRSNGQSKGMAILTFQRDESLKVLMEELPKKVFHGKSPLVAHCNKKNLDYYKSLCGGDGDTRKRDERRPNDDVNIQTGVGGSTQGGRLPNPLYNYQQPFMMQQNTTNYSTGNTSGYQTAPTSASSFVSNSHSKRKQPSSGDLENMIQKNWEVTNNAIRSAKINVENGLCDAAIQILHTGASMIRKSLVSDDSRCEDMIEKLEEVFKDIDGKYKRSNVSYSDRRRRSRSRSRSRRRRSPPRSRHWRNSSRDRRDSTPRRS